MSHDDDVSEAGSVLSDVVRGEEMPSSDPDFDKMLERAYQVANTKVKVARQKYEWQVYKSADKLNAFFVDQEQFKTRSTFGGMDGLRDVPCDWRCRP